MGRNKLVGMAWTLEPWVVSPGAKLLATTVIGRNQSFRNSSARATLTHRCPNTNHILCKPAVIGHACLRVQYLLANGFAFFTQTPRRFNI